MDSIDLYQVSLNGSIAGGPGPAQGGGVGADAGKRDIGRLGDVDTKDVDQLGDWFPECLP